MKKISILSCAAIAVASAVPIGALIADDKGARDGAVAEGPHSLAGQIEEELKALLGAGDGLLEEMLRNAAEGGGAFRLELDGDDAKKFLEGDREGLQDRLLELFRDAGQLDGEELRRQLRDAPGVQELRFELSPDDERMGDLMRFFQAQLANRKPGRNEKDHRSATEDYKPVVAAVRESTARLLGEDGKQLALATVVSADGYLVSKASELGGGSVDCEFADGTVLRARQVDSNEGWDLALLKVDAEGLRPAKLVGAETPELGTFLAAAGTGEYPIAIGVASVAPRNLSLASRGFLGIGMENADGGVRVREVQPNSGASAAGLEVGDILFEVDGKAVDAPAELAQAISRRKPKEEIHLRFRRDGEELKATAALGSRQLNARRMERFDRASQMGGPLSKNRDDFPNALQHDLTLRPEECGGPLVNLDGEVVGVNLARGGRVKSYAIPSADLGRLLGDLSDGRFSLAGRDRGQLEREIAEAEGEVEEMERQLERARQRREAARRALEKLGR